MGQKSSAQAEKCGLSEWPPHLQEERQKLSQQNAIYASSYGGLQFSS